MKKESSSLKEWEKRESDQQEDIYWLDNLQF